MNYFVHHLLQSAAIGLPEKEALVRQTSRLTYEAMWTRVSAVAAGFRAIGLKKGGRVGIYLDTSIPLALSIFGVSKAGGVFVPINSLLHPEQVAHIARDCGMAGLVTTRSKLGALRDVLKDLSSLQVAVVVEDGESAVKVEPRATHKSAVTIEGIEGVPARLRIYPFDELCQSTPPNELNDMGIDKDLAAILYTSGSTGRPKGVMLSHANIIAGSSIVSDYLRISSADRIVGVLPLSFDAGLNQLMTAIQQGGTYVPMTFVFAREIVKLLQREQITGMAGVPTLWSLMTQPSSTLEREALPHLRYITNTGGRMPENILGSLRRMLPSTKIFLMYGLTEAFRSTYLPPDELDRRPDSMGKAVPNTEILVVNERNEICKPGEIGELVHRGPTVSMGYWGQPELTAKVLRPNPFLPPELRDGEKVCYSGDLVRMDEDGFLYFVGRRDNLIKCSGYRVSPTEVEEVLFQSGKVREAGVIGIPDAVLGQAIKAFVVCREGDSIDADALMAFCAERVPRYMVPKIIEVVPQLPKTMSGKVDYPALRCRRGGA